MEFFAKLRILPPVMGLAIFLIPDGSGAQALEKLSVGAAGWMQYGLIVNSADSSTSNSLDGRSQLISGAQVAFDYPVSERLHISAGVGALALHFVRGMVDNPEVSEPWGGYAPMIVAPYVSAASLRYTHSPDEPSRLFIQVGWFPYHYSTDNQNLGLYLLRGPVYPGFLISGFETKHVLPVANTLGLHFHQEIGGFQHDALLKVETDFFPFYDLSPAYVASYGFGKTLRLGAGVNLYHWIPVDPDLIVNPAFKETNYVDTTGGISDTTHMTFRGTKFMANMVLDPRGLFGDMEALGPEDLKIYGEVALIGLLSDLPNEQIVYRDSNGVPTGATVGMRRKEVYEKLYGDTFHRMPMMAGINLPAFRLLDRLSFELEWYGAPFKDDLSRYATTRTPRPTPIPVESDVSNYTRDNWKWSVYGSRTFQRHIKLSFQVASDHFRPGIFTGYGDNNPPGTQAVLTSPTDWYWQTKIAYFF